MDSSDGREEISSKVQRDVKMIGGFFKNIEFEKSFMELISSKLWITCSF